jgi:predicted CoA-binding protein
MADRSHGDITRFHGVAGNLLHSRESNQLQVNEMPDWRDNLIQTPDGVKKLVQGIRRVAVLGIKTEAQADQAAFYVAKYLADAGLDVVPVPVYYPDATSILGQPVYRKLADVPGDIDLVDVFRRPSDIDAHVDDLIAKKPKAVWFQLGIRNDAAAEKLARAGIQVVQDRCLMVDHRAMASA